MFNYFINFNDDLIFETTLTVIRNSILFYCPHEISASRTDEICEQLISFEYVSFGVCILSCIIFLAEQALQRTKIPIAFPALK